MILGLLSDTHGDCELAAAGLRVLTDTGATAFLHCGDVGGPDVLDVFAGRRMWIVWGNSDWPETGLAEHARKLGFTATADAPLRFELAGRLIAAFHGHERRFTQLVDYAPQGEALRAEYGDCDYVIHGHTHIAADVRFGPLRLINPGPLSGQFRPMAATLDLAADRVKFHRIQRPPPSRAHP